MIHLRYEFKNRAAMLKELSKHFAKGVFIDGDIVDLGNTQVELVVQIITPSIAPYSIQGNHMMI